MNADRILNLQGRVDQLERLHIDQLSRLFEIVTEVHNRQLTNDFETANLVQSVPLTLRALKRDLAQIEGLRTEMFDRVGAVNDDLVAVHANYQALESRLTVAESGESVVEAVARDLEKVSAIEARSEEHAQSLAYLFGRVEFIRSEVMFQLRYGRQGAEEVAPLEPVIKLREPLEGARGLLVNLGCGHLPLEGYVNVDNRDLPGVDVVADVEKLPFEPSSIEELYSAHFLEHFPEERLRRRVLPYLIDLLAPGGDFRAVVPDVGSMMTRYVNGDYDYADMKQVIYGGQDYDGDFHYMMFTATSFEKLLSEAGLINFTVIAEARPNGQSLELEIVARKPGA